MRSIPLYANSTIRRRITALCCLAVVALALMLAQAAGEGTESIAISEEQVARGSAVYSQHCAECHGASLEGFGPFPVLQGRVFTGRWTGRPVSDLYSVVAEQMPLTAPGSLSAANYADVTAYLLARNGVEVGAAELDPEADGALQLLIEFGE